MQQRTQPPELDQHHFDGIRASRNRRLVEGALLADVAVVLLLGRVYLPIPIIRTIWRLLAGAPFVLLAQRQGLRTAIMAAIVAYVLLSALVGPLLALPALDTGFAAILVFLGMRWRLPKVITAVFGGLAYAIFDVVIPTVITVVIFRIPTSLIIGDLRSALHAVIDATVTALKVVNRIVALVLGNHHSAVIPVGDFRAMAYGQVAYLTAHWVWMALAAALIYSIVNVYGYQLMAELVIANLPESADPPGARSGVAA